MWLQTRCVYALWSLALGLPTCNNRPVIIIKKSISSNNDELQEMAGLVTEDERRDEGNAYLAPALKFDEEAHERLMAEAQQMDSVLKGEQARIWDPMWLTLLTIKICEAYSL